MKLKIVGVIGGEVTEVKVGERVSLDSWSDEATNVEVFSHKRNAKVFELWDVRCKFVSGEDRDELYLTGNIKVNVPGFVGTFRKVTLVLS